MLQLLQRSARGAGVRPLRHFAPRLLPGVSEI